ncbi:MAG: FAD:protein FMN transferase [Flavobacteriaceae bacterium]|jgi:thiamine biosynthesis lipoprotein|nr:FAD:protein FMN transferase [Flavobacteriaceae bacterium]
MLSIFKREFSLMGCRFDITLVSKNEQKANNLIDEAIEEMRRIEYLLSEWKIDTPVSLVNKNAGLSPVKVPLELLQITNRALQFSKMTEGAFDITMAGLNHIWKYDGSMKKIPSKAELQEAIKYVGYKNICIEQDKRTIFLAQKGMRIGFGSIGKAYAADCAKELLVQKGVTAGIVNASGDMAIWGKQPDGTPWTGGIINPLNKEKLFAKFPVHNGAVVTSGTYEKYTVINGKKYSHIIDPRTGMPTAEIASVTVFAPTAELANGLSTSIVIMGIEVGLHFINQIRGVSCVIVDNNAKIFTSNNIKIDKI